MLVRTEAFRKAATGGAAFVALGSEFDGTNDIGDVASDLASNADSKVGVVSCWIWLDVNDVLQNIRHSNGTTFNLVFSSSAGRFRLVGRDLTGNIDLELRNTQLPSTGAWHHLMISWDMASAGSARFYFDDAAALDEVTFVDDTLNYTESAHRICGGVGSSTGRLDGRLAEYYENNAEYIDFDVEANRRKFITAGGAPVDLGSDGSTPTGNQPIIYLSRRSGDTPDDLLNNRGYGGAISVVGALGEGGTVSL